jgi:hypothetical protein
MYWLERRVNESLQAKTSEKDEPGKGLPTRTISDQTKVGAQCDASDAEGRWVDRT